MEGYTDGKNRYNSLGKQLKRWRGLKRERCSEKVTQLTDHLNEWTDLTSFVQQGTHEGIEFFVGRFVHADVGTFTQTDDIHLNRGTLFKFNY